MDYQTYIIIGAVCVYIIFFIAAVGAFLPIIPGTMFASAALVAFKLVLIESPMSWYLFAGAIIIAVVAQVLDIVMAWVGAKKFGATWRGGVGAFVGVFVGIFLPPPIIWIFIAPLVCAFAFEYLGGAGFKKAGKAGIGAFVGNLMASVMKFLLIVFMAFWFTLEVFVK